MIKSLEQFPEPTLLTRSSRTASPMFGDLHHRLRLSQPDCLQLNVESRSKGPILSTSENIFCSRLTVSTKDLSTASISHVVFTKNGGITTVEVGLGESGRILGGERDLRSRKSSSTPFRFVNNRSNMSIRKRNEFLEGDDSEEELDQGYDSEEEKGKSAVGRHAAKRRKTGSDSEASLGGSDEEEAAEQKAVNTNRAPTTSDARFDLSKFGEKEDFEVDAPEQDEDDDDRSDHDRSETAKSTKSRAEKEAAKAQKAVRKSGVVYISRVPPFMKPQTLKHFLEPHARKGLGRVFLTPEDHVAHSKRVKSGGNKKKSFTDGWVEFNSKTEAKIAAETLNGNIIGGKKGNFYHDDLWNMKYLKGFKWHHLTEQIANENAERAARIREEIRRSRKENKAFVEDVERAKMLEGMESKKKAKREREGQVNIPEEKMGKQAREFKQRKAQYHDAKTVDKKPATGAGGVLRKIL